MKYQTCNFKIFIILHRLGLISLPDYYEVRWKNTLHRQLYSRCVYIITMLVCIPVTMHSVLVYAIHDIPEFLQRGFEALSLVTFLGVPFITTSWIEEVVNLCTTLETMVAHSKSALRKRTYRQIRLFHAMLLFTVSCLFVGIVFQPCIPLSDTDLYRMKNVYHLKPPYRKLPLMMRIPFADAYHWPVYVATYCLQTYCIVLGMASFYYLGCWGTVFIVPLIGQYEALCQSVRLMGSQHRNPQGERIFCTNITTGIFLTEAELFKISRLHVNTEDAHGLDADNEDATGTDQAKLTCLKHFRRHCDKEYDRHFIRQIIRRHQYLIYFKNMYEFFIAYVFDKVFMGPAFLLIVLAFYQLAYMSHLTLGEQVKVVFELLAILVADIYFIEISERLDDGNRALVRAINQSDWYRLDPEGDGMSDFSSRSVKPRIISVL
ncbi:hypothetical protein WDU94_001954 [Cyamophila willieti]